MPFIRRWQSSNCWLGRPYGPPIAFVVHTEAGGESGTVAEQVNSSAQFSAHYLAALDGSLDCLVDVGDRSWSNGILEPGNRWTSVACECGVDPSLNPNHVTISCETADCGECQHDVSDAQFNAVLYAGWEARLRFPDSLRYVVSHADISPQSRPDCPGDRWTATGRLTQLAQALELKLLT